MDTLFIVFITLSLCTLLSLLLSLSSPKRRRLPPGPPSFPLIGNLLWLRNSLSDIERLLRTDLRRAYGHVITLRIGSRASVYVSSHSAAHRALVQNGAVFSGRPTGLATGVQTNISSAPYGATWRLLRRNLTAEIFSGSRVKSYSHARAWVFMILVDRLRSESTSSSGGSNASFGCI